MFFFKTKLVGAFQLWAIFGRDCFIYGHLKCLNFSFSKLLLVVITIEKGFLWVPKFLEIFFRVHFSVPPKSTMEFIKNVFFQNKVSWSISTMGHFWTWLFHLWTFEVLKFQFFKTFARGHHHRKRFFVSSKIFGDIF